MTIAETRDGQTVFAVFGIGISAAVLCTTLHPSRQMQAEFGRDSAFVVEHPLGFASEIARQLPGFRHGLQGGCIYRDGTTIEREIERTPQSIDAELMYDLGGPERLLLKSAQFARQQEYRFLWEMDDFVEREHIDIEAPLARQFCRRIHESDYV